MNYRLVFILLFLYLAVSCNIYSFKGSLPPNINSICITPVLNTTSEFSLTNILNESVRQKLIAHNILDVVNISDADSKLDLEIQTIKDNANIYNSNNNNSYEIVEQWKLIVTVKLSWYNIKENKLILDKEITEWAMYNNLGIDISNDGIDNDNDGFTDSEDSNEFGSPREAAIRIITDKITDRVLNELISIW